LGIRTLALLLAGGILLGGTSARAAAQDSLIQRPLVTGLSFRGNDGIDDYTLRISIATTNSSAWVRWPLISWLGLGQRRYFDEREFRRDVLRLKLLYSQAGYPDAVIDTIVVRRPEAVAVTFDIAEGEPVLVTDLTITGTEGILAPGRLEGQLPLREGEPFNRLLLGPSTDTIRVALQNRGYPFVEVFRGFGQETEARRATVSFDVVPGPRATYDGIRITGAARVNEGAIRRLLPMRPGRPYRRRDLLAAQRDLYATGAFDYVDVRLADSVPETAGDSVVGVDVTVREGRFHRLRAAPGYGSEDCFRVLTGFSAARVLGGLRSFDVTTRFSKIGSGDPFAWGLQRNVCRGLRDDDDPDRLALNYNVSASLSEPAAFGRSIGAAVSVFAERRSELLAYVREGYGGEVSLTFRPPWDIPLTLSYELGRAKTSASPATTCFYLNVCRADDIAVYRQPRRAAILGLVAVRNRRNSLLDPSRGTLATAEVRWSSGLVGSDSLSTFTKLHGQFSSHHGLGHRLVLSWRVAAATLLPSAIDVEGTERFYVPPDQRLYAGGASTVRGFSQNELGPVVRVIERAIEVSATDTVVREDTLTSASGGTDFLMANVELRLPVPGFGGRLQAALFLDAGQVFDRGDEVENDPGIRVTPGLGIRFLTGVGPIRLDVGYNGYAPRSGPLYREEGDQLVPDPLNPTYAPPRSNAFLDRLRLHFSVGQAF
jgi:outer membrane protein insertion porin family/translocation and assembly module TamA